MIELQILLLFQQIVLLTVESQYVKHLTCNVLVAVSEFLAALVFYNFNPLVGVILYLWLFTSFSYLYVFCREATGVPLFICCVFVWIWLSLWRFNVLHHI